MKLLNNYYDQIKDIKPLKLSDAKKLYVQALNEQDETKRKELFDELILGTLNELYKYIENKGLYLLSNSNDIDDIVSKYTERWITAIHSGVLTNVHAYSLALAMAIQSEPIYKIPKTEFNQTQALLMGYADVFAGNRTYNDLVYDIIDKHYTDYEDNEEIESILKQVYFELANKLRDEYKEVAGSDYDIDSFAEYIKNKIAKMGKYSTMLLELGRPQKYSDETFEKFDIKSDSEKGLDFIVDMDTVNDYLELLNYMCEKLNDGQTEVFRFKYGKNIEELLKRLDPNYKNKSLRKYSEEKGMKYSTVSLQFNIAKMKACRYLLKKICYGIDLRKPSDEPETPAFFDSCEYDNLWRRIRGY
ncbi:MAG: hypothetical protein K5666_01090 [Bacilli bacterium]|nr:hypothetical protein [Bacilli bacterium]